MDIEHITENIFHLHFKTGQMVAKTFCRFQEFYESPVFKGKIFTLADFMRWYTANSPAGKECGEFTYYEDWGAFNIPSYVLEPFYKGRFDPLSREEKALLDAFRSRWQKGDRLFYVIGTCGERGSEEQENSLRHEIAHALYYTNQSYHAEIDGVLSTLDPDLRRCIERYFTDGCGYHPDVFQDELHGWIMTFLASLGEQGNIDVSRLEDTHRRLNKVFEHYCPRAF